MKLNNKGFVASTLMYSLLILFLFLILGLIALLSNRKMILDKLKNDIKEEVNSTKKYTYYENGTPIYFNPVTNKICGNYTEENSLNETKTGCLKWYIFNDDINKASVNMILDHNTTYKVAYNSTGSNSEMKEIKDELDALVNQSKWQVTPRLITADEIAHIVGADSNDTIKWKSNKPFGTNIDMQSNWFYLDGSGTSYSDSDGWQKQISNSTNKSKYAWLFDYIAGCDNYGCNAVGSNNYGYWTSNAVVKTSNSAWHMYRNGLLGTNRVNVDYGVRPVINVNKKNLKFGGTKVNKTTNDTHKGIIYMDPTNLNKTCTEQLATANVDSTTNLPTGIKKGCMKFYIFDDSDDNKYKLILDHNTTAKVAWNSSGSNASMGEVATALSTDTTGWLVNPRLITADEVAHIVGADRDDTIKWSSSKGYGTDDTSTKSSWFYLDGGRNSDPTVYASGNNGWQKKYANSSTPSNYAWLFDYTNGCTSNGCDTADSSTYGYLTSSPVSANSSRAWRVGFDDCLGDFTVSDGNYYGVRPVVELYKSIIN